MRCVAADVVEVSRWGDDFLEEIQALIKIEVKKGNKSGALGPGLGALRMSRFPSVTKMLLAAARSRWIRAVPWHGGLLSVLGDRRAPEARRILEQTLKARRVSDHARFMSFIGLAKLGDRSAVDSIRKALDATDVMDARIAALALNELIGTTAAMTRAQFDRVARWYDTHPAEVTTRFRKRTRPQRAKRTTLS